MDKKDNLKNELFWNNYVVYTAETSKISRQLAFGEGAILWFFFNSAPLNSIIVIGLILLVLFLIFFNI